MAKLTKKSFGVNSKMFVADAEESSLAKDIYRPNILKENVPTYTSVLKFLPWHEDTDLSMVKKWVVFITNPSSNDVRNYDCPTTLGKSTPSIFQTAFFACRESSKASIRDLQQRFKRSRQFFSIVQIISDEQHPELNGQIKIFQYTQQVFDKIKLMIEPESSFDEENDPFDLFTGKLFNFNIKIKTEGKNKYPDYTASKFLDKTHGIIIDGKQKKSEDDIDEIIEFLEKNSPDLRPYLYKELTAENKKFIADAIIETIPDGEELNKIIKNHPEFFNNSKKSKAKVDPGYDESEEDEDDEEEEIKPSKKKASAPVKTKAKSKVVEEDDDDDDDDDFIDDEDEDDEEEETKPSKKKASAPVKTKAKSKVVEEDDDEDEDDEEEEEIKPSKKKASAPVKTKAKPVVEEDDDDDDDDFDGFDL